MQPPKVIFAQFFRKFFPQFSNLANRPAKLFLLKLTGLFSRVFFVPRFISTAQTLLKHSFSHQYLKDFLKYFLSCSIKLMYFCSLYLLFIDYFATFLCQLFQITVNLFFRFRLSFHVYI